MEGIRAMVVNVTNTMKGLVFILLTPYIATICFVDIHCFVDFFFSLEIFPPLAVYLSFRLSTIQQFFFSFPSNEEKKAHWKKIIECAFILMRWEFSSFFLVCDCFDVKRFWSGMSREIRKLIHAINLNGHQIWQSFFTLPSNKFCLLLWKLTRESFKHFFRSLVFYAS